MPWWRDPGSVAMERIAAHDSVLPDEVVRLLAPADRHVLLDCTVGLGGHAEAMLRAADPSACLIGIDLDEESLLAAKQRLAAFPGRVRLFKANFADVREVLAEAGVAAADAIIADLGVASNQLDDSRRGFSFMMDGPLDMRLDRESKITAAELIARSTEADLADIIYKCGQERYSRRIARAIVAARKAGPIERTSALAGIVAGAIPAPARKTRRGVHPATRTFQALRIAVNDELANLDRLLAALPEILTVGGRAAVISFHSLEDRRVKTAFARMAAQGQSRILTKKPITPTAGEKQRNPRSRSAKLRVLERVA
jgi:16S rRNA (cytosine1402-N4)-methyltransferase